MFTIAMRVIRVLAAVIIISFWSTLDRPLDAAAGANGFTCEFATQRMCINNVDGAESRQCKDDTDQCTTCDWSPMHHCFHSENGKMFDGYRDAGNGNGNGDGNGN